MAKDGRQKRPAVDSLLFLVRIDCASLTEPIFSLPDGNLIEGLLHHLVGT